MNYKKLGKILGKIMVMEGVLMLIPLLVSVIYREPNKNVLAFGVPVIALVGIGFLLQIPRPKRETLYQREGFALTALVWVVMAVFGAIPFVINGEIPSYIDALFADSLIVGITLGSIVGSGVGSFLPHEEIEVSKKDKAKIFNNFLFICITQNNNNI